MDGRCTVSRGRETRALAQGGGGREGAGRAPKEGRRITPGKGIAAAMMGGLSANILLVTTVTTVTTTPLVSL